MNDESGDQRIITGTDLSSPPDIFARRRGLKRPDMATLLGAPT